MGEATHERGTALRRSPGLVAALAIATAGCAGVRPGGPGPTDLRSGEGRVVVAAGSPVMLEEGGGRTFVAPAPGASLTGIGTLRELGAGDPVRYRWRREVGGVRLAEQLDVAPVITTEPAFTCNRSELAVAIEQRRSPLLVDARPASDHRVGRLPGAVPLPPGAPDADVARVLTPDRSAAVVVYGEGPRDPAPAEVARRLLAAGAKDVRVYRGGIREWVDSDRWIEISADALRDLPVGRWLVVDVRPRARSAEARPAGAVSIPPEALRWPDLDGEHPLPPVLFVGADAADATPAAVADHLRQLRFANSVRTLVRLAVLSGGFEAWERAGLPVERGGTPRTAPTFVPVEDAEISPEEFQRLWASHGGEGSAKATLLDVRGASESPEPWVVKISLAELAGRLEELPRDREVVVYCAIGMRSQVAAELLRANGFRARFLRAQSGH